MLVLKQARYELSIDVRIPEQHRLEMQTFDGAILEEVVLRYTLISEGYSVKERHAVMAKLPVLDVPMMVSYVLFAYSRFCKAGPAVSLRRTVLHSSLSQFRCVDIIIRCTCP